MSFRSFLESSTSLARRRFFQSPFLWLAFLVVSSFTVFSSAQTRTIRVVAYNIEDDTSGNTAPLPGLITPSTSTNVLLGGVLEGIGEEILGGDPAQPLDILALEETTGNTSTVQPIVNGLNAFYGVANQYAMSPFQATSSGGVTDGGGPNALVYNTKTLQLLASTPVDPAGGASQLGSASGEYREVMRYEFAPAGVTPNAANEFYVYVSHFKASTGSANIAYRGQEAQIIRTNEALDLPAGARVLYMGDYNLTSSSMEPAYSTMLAAAAPNGILQGQAIDPMNPSGATNLNWSANSMLNLKTESATSLSYRDDLQLMTTNVYYGATNGLAYVPGTFHAFGNNGTTAFGGNVNSGSNTSLNGDLQPGCPISAAQLYQDLTTASDHLPVVADYTIPLPATPVSAFIASPVAGVIPLAVSFTNQSLNATGYAWDFGDGHSSASANPSNTYTNAGNYTVTLAAFGEGGTNILARANFIMATAPQLRLGGFAASLANGFQFTLTNAGGAPVTALQQSRISILTATNAALPLAGWTSLTNAVQLTNGFLRITDTNNAAFRQRFYRAVQTP